MLELWKSIRCCDKHHRQNGNDNRNRVIDYLVLMLDTGCWMLDKKITVKVQGFFQNCAWERWL
jgi:hypothetical protein